MSNRKWLYILIAVLALVLVAGIVLLLIHPGQESNVQTPTDEPTEGTTTVPMQDSVFDDVTKPSDVAQPTQGTTEPDENTQPSLEPTQSTQQSTDPTEETSEPTVETTAPEEMTYEKWLTLSPTEQRKYQESFPSLDQFFDWYNAAKDAYEKSNPSIEVGGGGETLP